MAYTIDDVKKYFTFANAGTGPTAAQTQQLQGIVNQNATGTYNDAQAFQAVVDLASDSTTAVSVETYAFFLGYAPSQAGLAALNAAYVGSGTQANLNGENRFIAQSVSLALSNATAKANFAAAYGSLSIVDATKAAYGLIVGNAAAAAAGINVDNAVAYLAGASSVAYYTAFVKANVPGLAAADLDLAVKAAIVGEIMYQATNFNFGAGVGSYSAATTTLLKDLADDGVLVANNNAGIDLFGSYGGTGTVGSTLTLTTSVDSPVATGNNDTINATDLTFTNLDTVDGLAGNDTLVIADTTGAFSTAGVVGATVKNVENISFKSVSTGTIDTTGWTGVQTLSTTTIGGVTATASGTTAVSVTEAALGAGAVNVQGGSTVSVNSVTTGAGTITVGGTTAPTGAVTVKASVAGTGNTTQGAISVTGGTTVSVTTAATQATNNTTTTQAAVTVTGTSTTTAVTVAQSAAVTAGASVKGIGAGAVTITDANGAHATKAGTIGTVTIANAGAVSITDNSLATLNLSGKVGTVGVTTGAGATVNALALNLGAGSTGAVTLATNYKTLNVGVTGANTVADVSATAATTLNVSGTAAVTFTANAGLTAVTTANVSLTALTKVDTTATTGTSSVTIDATKVAFAGGAGSDTVTLSGALASGGSISLGAGNDRLVGTTAVAASATSVVDGGTGTDTVASSLINAGNGSLFKAFEVLGLGANTLDAGLLTGSTITGLELYAGGGNGTFTNVVKAQSLSVTGTAAGGTTTLTFSDVAGSADAYTIGFNAATTGTASSPTTVAAGTLSIAGIETVNVVSSSASGVASNTITLLDTAAKSLVVTGSQALTVAFDAGGFGTAGANGLATIDASAATGAITLNTTNAGVATGGLTIVTGSGADVVTLGQGATVLLGAGNDTITTAAGASTITLGGGNDAVDAHLTTVASLVTPVFTTITDTFAAGDSLVFANQGTEVFNALDIAITAAGDTNAQIYWFQYAGNTYVVEHTGASTNLDTTDVVVKLAGLVDLSTASYTAGTNTLLAV
jgi:S-layer protein